MSKDALAVRVWTGYGLAPFRSVERTDFYRRLGEIFMPATVQIMQPLGLTAYLPTALPADPNPLLPDEVALVFYESRDAYHAATLASTGGRAYGLLHQTLFNFDNDGTIPKSVSQFPILFDPAVPLPEVPAALSLFSHHADWQSGTSTVLVVACMAGEETRCLQDIAGRLTRLQADPPAGLDGAIVALRDGYVVFWAHWHGEAQTMNLLDAIPGLRPVTNARAVDVQVPMPLTTPYAGLQIEPHSSLNFRFMPLQKPDGDSEI